VSQTLEIDVFSLLSTTPTSTHPLAQAPKLSFHYGSSALAIAEGAHDTVLPTKMTFPRQVIRAPPHTDLWRKPPHTDMDNAPTILISTPIDMHKFHTAKVTVRGGWNTLYDQGGLVLFVPDEDIKKWVKTGIEYVWGKPYVGTVVTSRWSDWSLVPLPESAKGEVTIVVERETKDGERVESLWIYILNEETGEKVGIREVTWWFRHDIDATDPERAADEKRTLLVGVYGARPQVPQGEGREKEELVVELDGFEVTLFEN